MVMSLYACDGYYNHEHGTFSPGCGAIFMPGAGQDDIVDMSDSSFAAKKGFCPVCGKRNVALVEVTVSAVNDLDDRREGEADDA